MEEEKEAIAAEVYGALPSLLAPDFRLVNIEESEEDGGIDWPLTSQSFVIF